MKKNYIEYDNSHWSKIKNPEQALEKYLNNYKHVYNKINIEKIIKVIPKNKKLHILDYGGGIGYLSAKLFELGHKVTLADQSSEAISTAAYFFKKENYKINILKAEKGYFSTEERYDIVIAKDLIEHVIEDKKMFDNLFGLLNKSGKLIITTQNTSSLNYLIEGTYKKIKTPKVKWLGWDRTHLRFYNPRSLKLLTKNLPVNKIEFRGSYIFPYKLIDILLYKLFRIKKTKFYIIDILLMKIKIIGRYGWNIMMICQKK